MACRCERGLLLACPLGSHVPARGGSRRVQPCPFGGSMAHLETCQGLWEAASAAVSLRGLSLAAPQPPCGNQQVRGSVQREMWRRE